MKKYITQGKIKQKNLSDILLYILEKGETSRREIERETGFSWGTVSESVMELLSRGYVTEEKSARTGQAGRNTQVLKPSGEKIAAIGVDVNLSGMGATVLGFDRSEKARFFRPFTAKTQEETLNAAISIADEAMAFCKDKYTVMAIGLAFQGGVDAESGVSIRFPKIENWMPVCVKELFERRYGIYTRVEHDPKCMLMAEAPSGSFDDCMLVRADEGIGLAVMQDGKIIDDKNRLELGHVIVRYGGYRCVCGRQGCLEAYSSIRGMASRAGVPFKELCENKSGYEDVVTDATKYFGVALHNAKMVFNPKKILLTGKLFSLLPEMANGAKEMLDALSLDGEQVEVEVKTEISASVGAAMHAVRSVIKNYKF